jgi:hypothetical protein
MIKTPIILNYDDFAELVCDFRTRTRFVISLDKNKAASFHPIGVPLPDSSVGGAVITIDDKAIKEAKENPAQAVAILLKAVNRSSLFLEFELDMPF